MNDFKPGLEGVVAFQTEIAEPDREGGALRYRGVDIEELVGRYPYENVWGLLVDDDLSSKMPDPDPYEPARLTGNAPADLQAETARLAGDWKLGSTVPLKVPLPNSSTVITGPGWPEAVVSVMAEVSPNAAITLTN